MLRWPFWVVLVTVSVLVHALISARVGEDIQAGIDASRRAAEARANQRKVVVKLEPADAQPEEEDQPLTDEPLDFEEEFELEPPEILLAPQAVVPPPPDVPLALTAQAGGAGEDMMPIQIAQPTEDAQSIAGRATVPTVGILAPVTAGGTSGGEGGGIAGFGIGIGNALGGSSNQFAAYIQGMREGGLDVLFVVDATGSMGWVLDEVKARIIDIAAVVRSLVPIARFGVVAYRDKDDPGFVTRSQPLTYSTIKVQGFLGGLRAEGGGNMFEAVYDGIKVGVEDSDWRSGARKIIILIGDAPPDEDRLPAVIRLVERFAGSGGVVSTLDVSDMSNPAVIEARVGRKVNHALYRTESMYQFRNIADAGNGDAATLEGDVTLTRRLVTLIMGDQFAREMQALLELI
jgi:hypothetical protein